jgi:hypothetical protein
MTCQTGNDVINESNSMASYSYSIQVYHPIPTFLTSFMVLARRIYWRKVEAGRKGALYTRGDVTDSQ